MPAALPRAAHELALYGSEAAFAVVEALASNGRMEATDTLPCPKFEAGSVTYTLPNGMTVTVAVPR